MIAFPGLNIQRKRGRGWKAIDGGGRQREVARRRSTLPGWFILVGSQRGAEPLARVLVHVTDCRQSTRGSYEDLVLEERLQLGILREHLQEMKDIVDGGMVTWGFDSYWQFEDNSRIPCYEDGAQRDIVLWHRMGDRLRSALAELRLKGGERLAEFLSTLLSRLFDATPHLILR